MLVDPIQAMASLPEVLKTTTSSSASSTSTTSIPSITGFPSHVDQYATDAGKRALWVVFVIMLVSSIAFTIMSFSVPVSKRLYHVITTLIVMIATVAYFGMAVGDGISRKTIHIKHKGEDGFPDTTTKIHRSVYWARYVDWSLTTPLLLLDLCLLAGLNGANIVIAIAADLFMVIVGLFAAFGNEHNAGKWGYYAIACVAYLAIIWQLAGPARAKAYSKGGKVGGFFVAIAGFTLILWTAYPIVWGVADGSRIASVDAEIIAYAVLDVLAKPVFGLWLLLTHANLPETNIDLGGFWAHGISSEGTIRVGDDDGA